MHRMYLHQLERLQTHVRSCTQLVFRERRVTQQGTTVTLWPLQSTYEAFVMPIKGAEAQSSRCT